MNCLFYLQIISLHKLQVYESLEASEKAMITTKNKQHKHIKING